MRQWTLNISADSWGPASCLFHKKLSYQIFVLMPWALWFLTLSEKPTLKSKSSFLDVVRQGHIKTVQWTCRSKLKGNASLPNLALTHLLAYLSVSNMPFSPPFQWTGKMRASPLKNGRRVSLNQFTRKWDTAEFGNTPLSKRVNCEVVCWRNVLISDCTKWDVRKES